MNMKNFKNRLNSDVHYRLLVSGKISFLMVWLIPITSWIPLLLLWAWNLYSLYRDSAPNKIRFFYLAVMVLVCILVLFNVYMKIISA